jgi:hypothetical protein
MKHKSGTPQYEIKFASPEPFKLVAEQIDNIEFVMQEIERKAKAKLLSQRRQTTMRFEYA